LIIYKAENKINGKVYIGKTVYSLEFRINAHAHRTAQPFSYALKKYGIENFDISIVDEAETEAELSRKEREWIKKCNCRAPHGYNLTDGGEGSLGYVHLPAARAKISKAAKGRKMPPRTDAFKKMMSDKYKGRVFHPWTEESKKKLSETLKKRPPASEETRAKLSKAFKGRIISDYVRKCISKANKGRVHTEETRKKMGDSHRGKPLSKEHRRKIGEGNHRRGPCSEETKRKISEKRIQWWAKRSTEERKQVMKNVRRGQKAPPSQILASLGL
jgi:group I intron endonuclease